MNIAAAILIIGACGSSSRTMVVEPSIEQIVLRVIAGGIIDVTLGTTGEDFSGSGFLAKLETPRSWPTVTLRIDGRERTGVLAWTAAAYRVAGYALSSETEHCSLSRRGSVEYAYVLRVRGFDVRRSTRISDGRVSTVTDVYGSIADGKLHHVRLSIRADETGLHETRIVGTATGYSSIGSRCRLVSRIASRAIARELDSQLLARIQRGGIDLYRAGSIVQAMR